MRLRQSGRDRDAAAGDLCTRRMRDFERRLDGDRRRRAAPAASRSARALPSPSRVKASLVLDALPEAMVAAIAAAASMGASASCWVYP